MTKFRTEVIGDCTLYLANSLDVVPTLDKSDAIVADPPYGYTYIPRDNKTKSRKCAGNFGYRDQIIGNDGKYGFDPRPFMDTADDHIWWGANCYADKLPLTKSWLIWDKACGGDTAQYGQAEMAWSSLGFASKIFHHRWQGMIRDSEHATKRVHPTQKPIAVMEWCIGFLPEAETILDPFMGSGTTGVACVRQGRSFTGIELDEKYYEIALKRIEEAYRQPDLFIEPPVKPQQTDMYKGD